MKGDIKKWYSNTEYVDIDTGEIITKSKFQRGNYIIKKTIKTYEIKENYGIIKYSRECEKSRQQQLWGNEL